MNNNLLNKLSNLTFYGFYDPSKNIVTVHFFNESDSKPDIIAYLNGDMSWDIREITSEVSTLHDYYEEIIISHTRLCTEFKDSPFDKFVRLGLYKIGEDTYENNDDLPSLNKMFKILDKNSYS